MENLNIKSLGFVQNKPYRSVLPSSRLWHVTAPLIGPKHQLIMLEHLSLVQNQEKQEVTLLFVQTDMCNNSCNWFRSRAPFDPAIGQDNSNLEQILLARNKE